MRNNQKKEVKSNTGHLGISPNLCVEGMRAQMKTFADSVGSDVAGE
jgi:hypothetical protein